MEEIWSNLQSDLILFYDTLWFNFVVTESSAVKIEHLIPAYNWNFRVYLELI